MSEITQLGISALKAGNRDVARNLLTAAIKQDPNDVVAWLWLTGTLNKDEERIACLRQVLKLDPGNQAAQRGLAQIAERQAQRKTTSPGAPAVQTAVESQPENVTLETLPHPELAEETYETPANAVSTAVAETPTAASQTQPGVIPAAAPVPSAAAALPQAPAKPTRKRLGRAATDSNVRVVFRSRPSVVPALICFWLFLIGALIVASLLSTVPEVGLPLAGGLALILEFIVLYTIIRTMSTRYELTNQHLALRFRGKRVTIPVENIYSATLKQTMLQQFIGIGHIEIDASVGGELARVKLRNISQCKQRAEQIQYLVRDNAPA